MCKWFRHICNVEDGISRKEKLVINKLIRKGKIYGLHCRKIKVYIVIVIFYWNLREFKTF
jgi:hypothetical protein